MAKPTVYNHLSDKATLFRHAMEAAAKAVLEERLAALDPLLAPDDLRAALEDTGLRLLRSHAGERSCALRRLLMAEVGQFPEILDIVKAHGAHRLTEAIADRLARLSLAGRLRAADPSVAAEQLLALLVGPLEGRTRMGTVDLPDSDLAELADAAADTFLRAYAATAG